MAQQYKIGTHATTVARDSEGVLRVTYHATPVVTVYPNGRIDLNTGGWLSLTTKARMNQASSQLSLGFHVWQRNFDWYVDIDGRVIEWLSPSLPITVRNGSD